MKQIVIINQFKTIYFNFSCDTPGIRFTLKLNNIFRLIYFAQLRHHQEDTDLYDLKKNL